MGTVALNIIRNFDARRHHRFDIHDAALGALLIFFTGTVTTNWSMAVNPSFSPEHSMTLTSPAVTSVIEYWMSHQCRGYTVENGKGILGTKPIAKIMKRKVMIVFIVLIFIKPTMVENGLTSLMPHCDFHHG